MSNRPSKNEWSLEVTEKWGEKRLYAVKKKFGFTMQSIYIADLSTYPSQADSNFDTLEKGRKFVRELNSKI